MKNNLPALRPEAKPPTSIAARIAHNLSLLFIGSKAEPKKDDKKLCFMCAHYSIGGNAATCNRETVNDSNLVYGERRVITKGRNCFDERRERGWLCGSDRCGPEGRYWHHKDEWQTKPIYDAGEWKR